MESNGVVSLIWHFAGYLSLPPDDLYTTKPIFDGGASSRPSSDAAPRPQADQHYVGNDNFFISGHAQSALVAPEHYLWRLEYWHKFKTEHATPSHAPPVFHHSLESFEPLGGGSSASEFHIAVTYGPGGWQEIVDLQQANSLATDNSVNASADMIAENNAHADGVLDSLILKAIDALPSFDEPSGSGSSSLLSFVNARDDHPTATQANDAPLQTSAGQYVNGQLYTDSADPHQLTNDVLTAASNALSAGFAGPPQGPTGDGSHVTEQTVNVGSNIQANETSIWDFSSSTMSLAVFGNYYSTNAIIQTNVFDQDNHISGAGAASLNVANNIVNNVADFQSGPPTLTASGGGVVPSEWNWNVTTVDGNVYNVNAISQFNYLQNNNVVSETMLPDSGKSLVLAGGNTQVNAADLQNIGNKFDLIIVEGNYHQANLIYQTNVALDANKISLGGGDDSGGAGQTATSGGNTVLNDATINNQSAQSFQSFNSSALSVTSALQHHQDSLNPTDVMSAFPNLAGGNVNALIVKGDYYDINAISQTNILSNSNVVSMTAGGDSAGGQQTVHTGHNDVVNAASIVDAGSATSPYLQGSFYNDMMLIQTNIIGNVQSAIAGENPNQLANEVIAFVTNDNVHEAGITAPTGLTDQSHHSGDVMGGIMH